MAFCSWTAPCDYFDKLQVLYSGRHQAKGAGSAGEAAAGGDQAKSEPFGQLHVSHLTPLAHPFARHGVDM